MGWDTYRELAFENQKQLGVVPPDAKLTPRPDDIPSWASRSPDEKRLYACQMEVFAGFLAHLDEHLGRLLDAVRHSPHADTTLIIVGLGDNGSSAEGGLRARSTIWPHRMAFPDNVATLLKSIDEIGDPLHENHSSVGWAWATNTPFQWTKQVASHFGGTCSGLLVSWPARIKDRRAVCCGISPAGGRLGLAASNGALLRRAMATERLGQEPPGRPLVPRRRQEDVLHARGTLKADPDLPRWTRHG
jgi:arylsulfatase A-like enzyme